MTTIFEMLVGRILSEVLNDLRKDILRNWRKKSSKNGAMTADLLSIPWYRLCHVTIYPFRQEAIWEKIQLKLSEAPHPKEKQRKQFNKF